MVPVDPLWVNILLYLREEISSTRIIPQRAKYWFQVHCTPYFLGLETFPLAQNPYPSILETKSDALTRYSYTSTHYEYLIHSSTILIEFTYQLLSWDPVFLLSALQNDLLNTLLGAGEWESQGYWARSDSPPLVESSEVLTLLSIPHVPLMLCDGSGFFQMSPSLTPL